MTPATTARRQHDGTLSDNRSNDRFASQGDTPAILADIYDESVNLAIWHRTPSDAVTHAAERLVAEQPRLQLSMTVSPQSALASVSESLGTDSQCALTTDIAELTEMFCSLLGVRRAGLRLTVLNAAMCPRFHVDRVPCRLVSSYVGCGSEWLPHAAVNRSKLGPGGAGMSDLESGLLKSADDIEQLAIGDVALLKGELWENNEGAGIVHRSPSPANGSSRLLLTLDVSD